MFIVWLFSCCGRVLIGHLLSFRVHVKLLSYHIVSYCICFAVIKEHLLLPIHHFLSPFYLRLMLFVIRQMAPLFSKVD